METVQVPFPKIDLDQQQPCCHVFPCALLLQERWPPDSGHRPSSVAFLRENLKLSLFLRHCSFYFLGQSQMAIFVIDKEINNKMFNDKIINV